jgi:hypothetical protein
MPKNPQEFADLFGAKIVGEVPDVGGGPFGMARLAHIMHQRLTPSRGERPGRPTDSTWASRPKVPMSKATRRRLADIAKAMSTPERQVSPMQVAAQLLEEAVKRVQPTTEDKVVLSQQENENMSELPPEVRLLPMDNQEEEFKNRSLEEVQVVFFLDILPRREGCYHYLTKGLEAELGSVVLFQFDKRLIASARFVKRKRFKNPETPYRGALYFEVESIKVFDPVSWSAVHQIWPECKGFNQVKQRLDPKKYPVFVRRLTGVRTPQFAKSEG